MNKPTFKKLCLMYMQQLTNFPYIEKDFDALTDYGLLCKVVDYLNEVIKNNNIQNESITNLYNAFIKIKDYIDNYFDNLDVQDEINNKLNEMAQDGSLTSLIEKYLNPYIELQNNRIKNMETKINAVVGGTPIAVSSIEDMTDTTKIYVLTTNGYWYYYDNSNWVQGGLYQSTGIAENEIKYQNLSDDLQKIININRIDLLDLDKYFEIGGINATDTGITYNNDTRRVRTKSGFGFTFNIGDVLIIPSGKRAMITRKNIDGTYATSNWIQGEYIFRHENIESYYIVIANVGSETAITSTVKEFINGFKIITTNLTDTQKLNNLINISNNESIFNFNDFDYGAVSSNNISTSQRRIYNKSFIKFENDTMIEFVSEKNILVSIRAFKTNDTTQFVENSYSDWQPSGYKMGINKDYYYAFTFRYDTDNIITDIYDFSQNIKILNVNYKLENKNINAVPKMIYHRGYSALRPENTLPAYKFVKDIGGEWAECDVQLTSDGVPVIIHDQDLSRTTNGTGYVNEITYNEFKQLYVRGVQYDGLYTQSLHYPSFLELLKYVKRINLKLIIELKETLTEDSIIDIVHMVEKYNMCENVQFCSFTLNFLKIVKRINKNIQCCYTATSFSTNIFNNYLSLGVNSGLGIRADNFTSDIVDKVHATGGFVDVWVVDTYDELMKYIDENIDYITTNGLIYNSDINYEIENLYHLDNGTTFEYTVPSSERNIYADVFEIDVQVYFTGEAPTLTYGRKTFTPRIENEFNMIKIQYAPGNIGNIPFKLEGNNCKFVDLNIRRYKKY